MFHNVRNAAITIVVLYLSTSEIACGAAPAVLSSAVIRGSTAYAPSELYVVYRQQVGQPITPANARAIVTALGSLYERDGYSRPEMKLDERLVARGVLGVDVFEPRMVEITIAGEAGPHRRAVEEIAAALQDMQPIRRDGVQRAIARMRELPGLTINATTQRKASSNTDYVLSINAGYSPVEGALRVSNRGTNEVGRNFVFGNITINGLLGGSEKVGALFAAATDYEEYHGAGVFAELPLTSTGTRAHLIGFRSRANPTESSGDRADVYLRERVTLRITHPLRTAATWSAAMSSVFELDDLEIQREKTSRSEDRIRAFELGGRLVWRAGGRTQYSAVLDVRKGIDGLGSGLEAPHLAEDVRRVDFLLTRLQLVQLTQLSAKWSIRVDALGQHTGYVLPYSERFKVGGERIGRGFEVAEVAGDQGAGAKMELRRHLAGQRPLMGRASLYGFYDFGATWRQNIPGRESAATAGVGAGLQGGRMTGYLEIAKPLTRPNVEQQKSPTVFAELGYRF